jgi:hypothetical protein
VAVAVAEAPGLIVKLAVAAVLVVTDRLLQERLLAVIVGLRAL